MTVTERLYYKDQYLKEVEAVVTEVRKNGFLLDRTIFYPECGGQRGDSGYYGDLRIKTTIADDSGEPLHITDGKLPVVGEKRLLKIDWEERKFGMVEHTAQHLLSSVLFSSSGINTVAVHHGEDEITIETDRAAISNETLFKTEEEAIRLISENRRVYMEEMDRAKAESLSLRRTIKVEGEKVKVVFIEGQDAVPCGGVHLKSLGEIEELTYVGVESIRGHVRTIWRAGRKARELRRLNSAVLNDARVLLSSKTEELTANIEKLIRENRDDKRELHALRKTLSETEFNSKKGENIVYSTSYSLDDLIEAATSTKKNVFIAGENNTFLYSGSKETFTLLKEKFSLRGGGREPLFRGQFSRPVDEILSGVESFLCSC